MNFNLIDPKIDLGTLYFHMGSYLAMVAIDQRYMEFIERLLQADLGQYLPEFISGEKSLVYVSRLRENETSAGIEMALVIGSNNESFTIERVITKDRQLTPEQHTFLDSYLDYLSETL